MRTVRFFMVVFGLVIATLASTTGAGAQATSTITIHHRLCPGGYAGADYFGDCHDRLADQSFEFTVESAGGPDTQSTDAATGNVTFSVASGSVEIYGGVPGEFADTFVYCSRDDVAVDLTSMAKGVSFDAPEGDYVCDWYNTPVDLSGGGSEDDDDTGTDDVTDLPNTGVGPAASSSMVAVLLAMVALAIGGGASLLTMQSRAIK